MSSPTETGAIPPSKQRRAILDQDEAAGGVDRRKILLGGGDTATVSLALGTNVAGVWRVTLRFKHGGRTTQRPVGSVHASDRREALLLGWKLLRSERIVENNRWAWMLRDDGD